MDLGYARVSTTEQNLDLQRDDLIRAGIPKESIHVEKRSGAKRLHELEKVTALLGQGDSLTAWKLDRLGRTALEVLGTVKSLIERGVIVRTLKDSVLIDPGSAMGNFWLTMLAAQAQLERDLMIERVKAGRQAAKARGKFVGSARLYGFESKPDEQGNFQTIPAEAAVLQEITRRVLDGASLSALVRDLRTRAIPTSLGKQWTPNGLRRVLENSRMAQILGPATHLQLLRVFANPQYRKQQGRPSQHLLSGIVTCALCKHRMYVVSRSKHGNPIYRCRHNAKVGTCGKVQISAPELERFVVADTIAWLAGPGLARVKQRIAAQDADLARIQAEVSRDETLLETAAREAGEAGVSLTVLRSYVEPIETRLQANRGRLKRVPALAVLQDIPTIRIDLQERWQEWSLEKKRAILKASIASLKVFPTEHRGPGFDEDRVKLVFVSDVEPFSRPWATEEANGGLLNQVAKELGEEV
jgi:DNA invertase Pin-like site-specific DNA recombinase